MNEKYGTKYYGWQDKATREEYEHYRKLEHAVPEAPFEKNWHELAMKRMLRFAAENGFDKVAWTKGKQQSECYKLDDVLPNGITAGEYEDMSDMWGDEASDAKEVYAYGAQDNEVLNVIVNRSGLVLADVNDTYTGRKLRDLVGSDIASKLLADGKVHLDGVELKAGGKGMEGFYDKMLVDFMNKYGKKWGVKVGEVELPNLEEAGRKMWSVDVTPEMRESVMQGQPKFSFRDEKPVRIDGESLAEYQSRLAEWRARNAEGRRAAIEERSQRIRGGGEPIPVEPREPETALEGAVQTAQGEVDEQTKTAYRMKDEAVRSLGLNMNKARQVMARQREYGRETVDSLKKLVEEMMDETGTDGVTKSELQRILGKLRDATGKKDITDEAEAIVNIILNNTMRAYGKQLDAIAKVKGVKRDSRGVLVNAGKKKGLDPRGVAIML